MERKERIANIKIHIICYSNVLVFHFFNNILICHPLFVLVSRIGNTYYHMMVATI
jgi:hypothetical protein